MKRIFFFMLVVMLAALSGCAPRPAAETVPTSLPQPSAAPATNTPIPTAAPPVATPTLPPAQPAPAAAAPEAAALWTRLSDTTVPAPYQMDWSTDGQTVGIRSGDNLKLLSVPDLGTAAQITVQQPFSLLAYSTAVNRMAVSSDFQTIELREITTGAPRLTINPGFPLLNVSFSADGSRLVVSGTLDIGASIYNTASGSLEKTLTGFETAAPVYSVSFSPDGRQLVWVARATLQLQDIATGKMGLLVSNEDFISAFAFSPDGTLLALGTAATGADGVFQPVIRRFVTASGIELTSIPITEAPPAALAINNRGVLAAGGSALQIWWNVEPAQLSASLPPTPGERISGLAFSPDGTQLLSADTAGQILLWQAPPAP